MRREHDVLAELWALCTRAGYVHVLTYICLRDNFVEHSGSLTEADLSPMYAHSRLIRTEITTLVGLMVKKPMDFRVPSPDEMQQHIDDTGSYHANQEGCETATT
ncbi:MAG: hypothetical protein U1F52_05345 [Burkholderiales bacterium]